MGPINQRSDKHVEGRFMAITFERYSMNPMRTDANDLRHTLKSLLLISCFQLNPGRIGSHSMLSTFQSFVGRSTTICAYGTIIPFGTNANGLLLLLVSPSYSTIIPNYQGLFNAACLRIQHMWKKLGKKWPIGVSES